MPKPPKITVLLVEDEPLVLIHSHLALEDAGFAVVTAPDASVALHQLTMRRDIDAVFTDVCLPGEIDGIALAEIVGERWPDIAIVVTSGSVWIGAGSMPPGARFVAKPYTSAEVSQLIAAATA